MDVELIVRTYEEGIEALKQRRWQVVYLDHDLADSDPRKTGYGILCWLEANRRYLPERIELVTANPVGRQNMMFALNNLYPVEHSTEI